MVARPGLLAHVSLEYILSKSLLTLCLPEKERCSDRIVPPWKHIQGNSDPEKSRDLPELTQEGRVAEEHRSENLSPKADSLGSYTSPDIDLSCDLGIVPPLWASVGPYVKLGIYIDDPKLRESLLVSSPKILPLPQKAVTQALATPPPPSQQSWWLC